MHHFQRRKGRMEAEGVPLTRIAQEVGTPCYVYSRATLTRHYKVIDQALHGLDHLICFSVKANNSLAILKLLAGLGGGADILSGGELYAALAAGIPAGRICFSGVGKTEEEMAAAIEAGILMFNVESLPELEALERTAARLGRQARMAIRVNPDVDPKTHPYISTGLKENKFGLDVERALEAYLRARRMSHLEVVGVDCHIGSQLTELSPFVEALRRLKVLVGRLKAEGLELKYLDMGGGLGIPYSTEQPPQPLEYAQALGAELKGLGLTLILEPGRVIVGNAGILLTRVLYLKETGVKRFIIVDAAMNDLVRPSLYGAFHQILPVVEDGSALTEADVVGPICESTDFLAKNRPMPQVKAGDLLAVMSAGAYGYSMASNFNARPRPAEVMVSGQDFAVIRPRETVADLARGQIVPDFLSEEA
ncbi:MAG: diaminopimelate decarboxylase [Deltaproteobacteria bacterium]|nr:diaminopimelate decarboxylase [Deltaproteobacteria bacterium]